MDFSNSTSEIGLIQEVDRICGSTDNTYSLKAKTARINAALDRFCFLALSSGDVWIFDDLNQTDMPIATTNLVSAQQTYDFPDEILSLNKVLIKDSSGNWLTLTPLNIRDEDSQYIWTKPTSNTGTPSQYAKFAHSLFLDPIPNYSSTAGLKVIFQRNLGYFVSTDTTKDPGIPPIFHPYLARYAALQFCLEKGLSQTGSVGSIVAQDEQAIKDFFQMRNRDIKYKLKPVIEDCR